MAKAIKAKIKLQIPAGAANPAPPVGSALGQHGVAIQDFCSQFNEKTKAMKGDIIPVIITVFEDRSFTFITKTPPTAELIKKELKLAKGSGTPNKDKVGEITEAQLEKIALIKMPDITANDIEAAKKIVAGTAKSMGLKVK
ncbi:MAG: 50S ribosomal protein L11 [Patescibacteria group bacterium]